MTSRSPDLLFDVPLLIDPSYLDFLSGCQERIHSVHFSLPAPQILDGRSLPAPDLNELCSCLAQLATVKKFALLNSRFLAPGFYLKPDRLTTVLHNLEVLRHEAGVDGLVFNDHYLLHALAQQAPALCQQLEAVPGVNSQLDSVAKIEATLASIRASGFRQPGKLILDREMNRDLKGLQQLSTALGKCYPQLAITLLANEGCLRHCPFKLSHDAHIAHANSCGHDLTHQLNSHFGCINILQSQPQRLLSSPMIRPEDTRHYQGLVQVIKLCGRTLGGDFLKKLLAAYLAGQHHGNLLELLDAPNWLSHTLYLANEQIPATFHQQLSQCGDQCQQCNYCQQLFKQISEPLPIKLADFRRS